MNKKLKRTISLFLSAILLGSVIDITLPVSASETTTTYTFDGGIQPFEANDTSLAAGNQTFTYSEDVSLMLHDSNSKWSTYCDGVSGTAFTNCFGSNSTRTRTHGYVMEIGDEKSRPTKVSFDMKVVSGNGANVLDALVIYPLTFNADAVYSDGNNKYSNHLAMDIFSKWNEYAWWGNSMSETGVGTKGATADSTAVFSQLVIDSCDTTGIPWSTAKNYVSTAKNKSTNAQIIGELPEYAVVITYDWLDNNQVTISATLTLGSETTKFSFTVTYDPDHIADMYHFGFLATTANHKNLDCLYLMDNLTVVSEQTYSVDEETEKLNTLYSEYLKAPSTDTVLAFVQAYESVQNASVKATFADRYAEVKEWEIKTLYETYTTSQTSKTALAFVNCYDALDDTDTFKTAYSDKYNGVITWGNAKYAFTGYDDFSDPFKSYILWSDFDGNAVENETLTLNGATDKIALPETVCKEGFKPSQVRFRAKASATVTCPKNSAGLRFNLLESDQNTADTSDDLNAYLSIGTYEGGNDNNRTGVGTWANNLTMSEYTINWKPNYDWTNESQVGLGYYSMYYGSLYGTDVMEYILSYDWTSWSTEGKVVIVLTTKSVTDSTKGQFRSTITYTCNDLTNIPQTLNVGFQNLSGTSTVDNFEITYICEGADGTTETVKPTIIPKVEVSDATLVTNPATAKAQSAIVEMEFDFAAVKRALENNGETAVEYGVVIMPGTPESYAVMKENAISIVENNGEVTGYERQARPVVDGELPTVYNVRILNSEENMGKRMTAIAYIKVGECYYYSDSYSSHSVTSLLKEITNDVYLADSTNVADGEIVQDSALYLALNAYNTANGYNYDLAAIQTAATTTEVTTDEQKALLKAIYFGITYGVDTEVTE